jgi:hypothetical protein
MKRVYAALAVAVVAVAVVAMSGSALLAPAHAAPPTVTPSPGYDARLQEQRARPAVVYEPAPPPVARHHVKHKHHHQ